MVIILIFPISVSIMYSYTLLAFLLLPDVLKWKQWVRKSMHEMFIKIACERKKKKKKLFY